MVCKMKKSEISEDIKSVFKDAANKLNGSKRRQFRGNVAIELLDCNARKAEREFGWGRETVKTGMADLSSPAMINGSSSSNKC